MPQNKVTLESLNPPVNTTSPAIPALRKRTAPLSIALLLTILGILLLRIASIGSMPLVDPSESRYALVAKLMDSSGNYLVPHFVDHEGTTRPFWAKPPLFFWANALSNQLFGSSDASARLPSLLAAIGTILLVGVFTQAVRMRRLKMIAMLFTASSGVFFAYAGLCQMDMLLTFTTALALCSFTLWHQSPKHKGLWSTIFSASLACGLLTKGPVVVALVVITITLPTLYRLLRASRLRPIAATKLYLRLKKARGKITAIGYANLPKVISENIEHHVSAKLCDEQGELVAEARILWQLGPEKT